jgi:hypothetical protein
VEAPDARRVARAARHDYARSRYAFDPSQPGARRLLEMARQIQGLEPPRPVELLTPVWLVDEDRPLHDCGDRVVLPADVACRLIDEGLARDCE